MLQEESLEQGSCRSVPEERLQEENATGGRSKRMKLQEVEALSIEDSMRWGLHKKALGGGGSRSRKLQGDLPLGGSRRRGSQRRRLHEEDASRGGGFWKIMLQGKIS